jgi:hypothetical protein
VAGIASAAAIAAGAENDAYEQNKCYQADDIAFHTKETETQRYLF